MTILAVAVFVLIIELAILGSEALESLERIAEAVEIVVDETTPE